jgi:tetratricopeptide (TPR) repeat protein
MEAIYEQFQKPPDQAVIRPRGVVLYAMGGSGKSQLAMQFCQQAENQKLFSVILWLDADSPKTMAQSLANIAHKWNKTGFNTADAEGNLEFVRDRLKSFQDRWLLVFDNLDNPDAFPLGISQYYPQGGSLGSLLFTTRSGSVKSLGFPIEVTAMLDNEALELLLTRSQLDRTDKNIDDGTRIVERLGYHALAVDQAGAYIQKRGLKFERYLQHYYARKEKVLEEVPALWEYRRKLKIDSEVDTKLSVFTTWELSLDLISDDRGTRKDKEHILTLAAFLDAKEVSENLFRSYSAKNVDWLRSCMSNGSWDEYEAQDMLTELRNLSLLQTLSIGEEGAVFSLHPMIQDWIKLRIPSGDRPAFNREAILVLSTSIGGRFLRGLALENQAFLSHMDVVLQNDDEYHVLQEPIEDSEILDALSNFASFFRMQGRYQSAEHLGRLALRARMETFGKEQFTTLNSANDLALTLEKQGNYIEAEQMNRQTLQLMEKVLGEKHQSTMRSKNNLAMVLARQGKYAEAEQMYRQALNVMRRILGKEHSGTLHVMSNLGVLLEKMGKYDKAEEMSRETLLLREKVGGKEHIHTLTSMNNLATILRKQGKYYEAEQMHRQELQLGKMIRGKDHPDTLLGMNNLALSLIEQGKNVEATEILRQALQLTQKVCGKEHPDTLVKMSNLARALRSLGEYTEAEQILRQSFKISEKHHGLEHPTTITSIRDLAVVLNGQGKHDEAEQL